MPTPTSSFVAVTWTFTARPLFCFGAKFDALRRKGSVSPPASSVGGFAAIASPTVTMSLCGRSTMGSDTSSEPARRRIPSAPSYPVAPTTFCMAKYVADTTDLVGRVSRVYRHQGYLQRRSTVPCAIDRDCPSSVLDKSIGLLTGVSPASNADQFTCKTTSSDLTLERLF